VNTANLFRGVTKLIELGSGSKGQITLGFLMSSNNGNYIDIGLIYFFVWVLLFAAVWVDRRTVILIDDPGVRHILRSAVAGMAIPFGYFKFKEDREIGLIWFIGIILIFLYVVFFT
jgi:hypothetical protein